MRILMHGWIMAWLMGIFLVIGSPSVASEKLESITLSGPFAAVSDPLVVMMETEALLDVTKEIKFVVWKNPDQMRALAMNADTDFMAMPTNVAANLYNRGMDLKMLNVSVWGVLYMMSRDEDKETLADFKGEEIAMPFRGDMPDILFTELAVMQGLDPKKDFKLRYVSNPLDAMRLLIMRRVDHALLAEPAVSMALRKVDSGVLKIVAPTLYRSVDLQKEWGRLLKKEARIPQAGMVLLNSDLDEHVVSRFIEEYDKAVQWCLDHPAEAGEMVARHIDMLTPEAISDSIRNSQFRQVKADVARPELEFLFEMLMKRTPALVGGAIPDDGFYYQNTATKGDSNED